MPPGAQLDASAASSTAKNDDTPPGQGKDHATPSLENLQGENKRLSEQNVKLKEQLEDSGLQMDELKERLTELEKQGKRSDDTVDQKELDKIISDPRNKAVISYLTAEAKKEARAASYEDQIDSANALVEEEAEKRGIDIGKSERPTKEYLEFVNQLKSFSLKYADLSPVRRNQRALKDFIKWEARIKNLEEREKAIKEKEDQDRLYAERGGRSEREVAAIDSLEKAKTTDDQAAALKDILG